MSRWRQQPVERAPELFTTPASRSAEQARIAELERLVGQLTLALAAAKTLSLLLTSPSSKSGR
ncbi:MAG: hypothetical protein Q9O62_10430 [Ardenticatenia bacterium]|nr:hypothetical protein [Ardenticatenia bacterium]